MMVLRLLGRKTSSNVQKVLWCLGEMEIPFEREDIGGEFGKNDQPAYLALNPNGRVPTIIDSGFVLWESNVILRYLCAKYSHGTFYPADLIRRADAERWMDWQQTTLGPHMGVLFRKYIRKPVEPVSDAAVQTALIEGGKCWAMLETVLGKQPFIAGIGLSMADFALGNAIHRWFSVPTERPALPAVKAYYERLCARPAYQKAMLAGSRT
jgi:glutathione S-transferase